MDLNAWKEAVTRQLQKSARFLKQMTPGTLYGTLAASSLLPVIAAANGGDFAALMALASVVGGVGGNLIANQIQSWKDYSDEALAAELGQLATTDPQWREALDAVLVKLETPQIVQSILAEADKDWFTRTLRQELAHIGSTINLTVTGDVHQLTFGQVETVIIESAIFQAPPDPGQVDPRHLLWTYLNQVVTDTATVDLTGVDRKTVSDQDEARLDLAAVYTALKIKGGGGSLAMTGVEEDDEDDARLDALGFVVKNPTAALLGDPGSGKTTFTNFLALCLAGEFLGLDGANLARLGDTWTLGRLLPVRVVLRTFAAQLPDLTQAAAAPDGEQDLLWAYIQRRLGSNLAGFAPLLNRYLLEEGGLLILDGLDEVPEAHHYREQVKAVVLAFQRRYPRTRILLTSRTYAYQRQAWRLPDFAEAVLAPFDEEQIDAFVDNWYAHMATVRPNLSQDDAQGRAVLLKHAIQRNHHLRELAPRPLLLTLMASLHAWRGGNLPNQREELYDESVDLLLDIWERPKIIRDAQGKPVIQSESAAAWFKAPQARILTALEDLAFQVHSTQEQLTGTADIPETELVAALLAAAGDPDLVPARVVEYVRDRAGLIVNQGNGVYSLPHRTFQEYLAARHLTRTSFPKKIAELARQDPERWREVLLLAGAKATRGAPAAAWSLARKLCPVPCQDKAHQEAQNGDWWTALLAGQLLVETEIYLGSLDRDEQAILDQVVGWLVRLVEGGHLPPIDRAAAGVALGKLGDPRPGVGLKDGLPDIAWQPVELGPFLMGSTEKTAKYKDEKPQFTCNLITQPYVISRYPITVAQYAAFVKAKGYEQRKYWTDAGWDWREKNKIIGPDTNAEVFQTPNHPQVGVSWYEAVAFCNWLSQQSGREVRLPTEAEWERAARSADGREYPWGDGWDRERCNNTELNIGSTTAVGIFPSGDALSGAADMSGNVWEWCGTKWQSNYEKYEEQVDNEVAGTSARVLRGGSFAHYGVNVRCAIRYRHLPRSRVRLVGFRVVSPGFWPLISAFL